MAEIHNTGRIGEELTVYYLQKHGYKILRRNYRIKGGEIDIIAEKDGIIAFVEVKTRSDEALEQGVFAVGKRKMQLIIRASEDFILRSGNGSQPRYDIADVTLKNGRPVKIRYYDNAFSGDDI